MSVATFREAVRAELETDLQIPFKSGLITFLEGTGSVRGDVGCVWVAGYRENGDSVQEQIIDLRVRVYRKFIQVRDPLNAIDPTALEDTAELVESALRDKQAAQFGVWFFRPVSTEIDLATQGVEVTVTAIRANPFTV